MQESNDCWTALEASNEGYCLKKFCISEFLGLSTFLYHNQMLKFSFTDEFDAQWDKKNKQ